MGQRCEVVRLMMQATPIGARAAVTTETDMSHNHAAQLRYLSLSHAHVESCCSCFAALFGAPSIKLSS